MSCWSEDVGGTSGNGMHRRLKAESTRLGWAEPSAVNWPGMFGVHRTGLFRGGWNEWSFYGSGRGTRAVRGFKLRFTSLYNAGFPSYTVGYQSTYESVWPESPYTLHCSRTRTRLMNSERPSLRSPAVQERKFDRHDLCRANVLKPNDNHAGKRQQ